MKNLSVSIPCGNINLEAELSLPDVVYPVSAVVICHPHPLYGGDMHNNVVTAIYEALCSNSIAALRFNFRGVGASGGAYGHSIAEKDDVGAVLDYLENRPEIDKNRMGLAGYSFGGAVAFNFAGEDKRVRALFLISPVFKNDEWEKLNNFTLPLRIIAGEKDNYIAPPILKKWFKEDGNRIKIPGADHFWQGFEQQLKLNSVDFFRQSL
jgi:alpha/beta superfamily hydrolase